MEQWSLLTRGQLDSRMIKRKRIPLMRTFHSQFKSTVELHSIFERQEYEVEEALPASGVLSTAVSVPSELDRGFLVPRHALNNEVWSSPSMDAISRMLPVFLRLRGIVSDSFAGVASADCVTSNSDRSDIEASLSDAATSSGERISSTQTTPSSELCHIALHRLISCEEDFAGNVLSGVQMFSRPLRHYILTQEQHSTLFQNIEKLMVLSEGIARSLRDLCSCDNNIHGGKGRDIGDVYLSKLQLMSQAYSQYLPGMTSAWQVLRELRKCPEFITFVQMRNENSELTIESFLQVPNKHVQELRAEFRFLLENCSESMEDSMAFETLASTDFEQD